MRMVVTGGAGFIGSNLVAYLNAQGCDRILVVDDLTKADKCLNLNRARFEDLVDRHDFAARIEDFGDVDTVVHLGACTSTTEKDGRYLLANNHEYSKRVLAWAQGRQIRLIYASSASVYGDGQRGFDEQAPAAECPLGGYAFSKWLFDRHVRRMAAEGAQHTPVVGLRFFNVYGPQEWHKGDMCSPMLHWHRQIEADGGLRLFAGSERFRRDFVTVEDCCAVIGFFLERPGTAGLYNCGTGKAHSFAEAATMMLALYPGATVTEVPFPQALRGGYQGHTCADLARLRAAGYERPFVSLPDGLARYVHLLQSPSRGYLP